MVGFPLLWDFKRGHDRTTVVFPFYARWQRDDHVGTYVFPIYYARTGLGPDGKPDGTWRHFVFPFYDSGVQRPGDFMWEVLGGLFGHERIGRHNYLRLFYFTVETSPTQPQQAAWYGQARRAPPQGGPARPERRRLVVSGLQGPPRSGSDVRRGSTGSPSMRARNGPTRNIEPQTTTHVAAGARARQRRPGIGDRA